MIWMGSTALLIKKKLMSGYLITLEGVEGAGKSTIAQRLAAWLEEKKIPYLLAREPGGTPAGEAIRQILLNADISLCRETELLLFEAARAQLMTEKILPALALDQVVILDRFIDSTMAYQGYGRGMNREFVDRLNQTVGFNRVPDLTILLDIDVKIGLERAGKVSSLHNNKDRFETEAVAFMEAVRQGFLQIASQAPQRVAVVPVEGGVDAVWGKVRVILENRWSLS